MSPQRCHNVDICHQYCLFFCAHRSMVWRHCIGNQYHKIETHHVIINEHSMASRSLLFAAVSNALRSGASSVFVNNKKLLSMSYGFHHKEIPRVQLSIQLSDNSTTEVHQVEIEDMASQLYIGNDQTIMTFRAKMQKNMNDTDDTNNTNNTNNTNTNTTLTFVIK